MTSASFISMMQDVADEIGIERNSSYIGNSNDTARRLVQAAKRTGRDLLRAHDWSFLINEHTFTTVDDTATYSLPSDFDRFLQQTQWDRTNEWRLRGPRSAQYWQWLKSGVAEEGPRTDYRVWSGPDASTGTSTFYISPTPASGHTPRTLVFEYVSNTWVRDSAGNPATFFNNDEAVTYFDEDLFTFGVKWRVLRSLGLEYVTEYDEYDRLLRKRMAEDGDMPRLSMTGAQTDDISLIANIQDANFPSS